MMPHLSLARLETGCLWSRALHTTIDCGRISPVAWPPMPEALPRTMAERDGGRPGCLLLKGPWVRPAVSPRAHPKI